MPAMSGTTRPRRFFWGGIVLSGLISSSALAAEVSGLCEASGGAFLDATHFAVASDETNVLRVYDLTNLVGVGTPADLQGFAGADKSDLEAAARSGDRIFWVSSHSVNSSGVDRPKRQRFFASAADTVAGSPTIKGAGRSVESLRDPILTALGFGTTAEALALWRLKLNIEGLAAGRDGSLLLGLRGPLADGNAIVLPFNNPGEIADGKTNTDGTAVAPAFGAPLFLDLEGKGIRDFARIPAPDGADFYLIIAGPQDDGPGFALWRWNGPTDNTLAKLSVDLGDLRPEAALPIPESSRVLILSDDGALCSDEDDPVDQRKFRTLEVDLSQ